jgi:hypothetical protein
MNVSVLTPRVERMYEGDHEMQTDEDAQEAVRFAEACGLRVFWVEGLLEGALCLARQRIVMLDSALSGSRVKRALDAALSRIGAQ